MNSGFQIGIVDKVVYRQVSTTKKIWK